jgi:hypothetical protein
MSLYSDYRLKVAQETGVQRPARAGSPVQWVPGIYHRRKKRQGAATLTTHKHPLSRL